MSSLRSRVDPAPRRHPLAAAIALGACCLATSLAAQAQALPPAGVGVYVTGSVAGTNNYAGNGEVSYATGPGVTIYSGGGLSVVGAPNFAVTSSLDLAPGLTAATVSAIGSGGIAVGEVHSTADLAGGVLRASASGVSTTGYSPLGPASARSLTTSFMQDFLNFSVAGGGTADITVTAHLDGSFAIHDPNYASFSQAMALYFGGGSFNEIGGGDNSTSYYGVNGASGYVPPSGWQSYTFSNQTPEGFDFTGVLQVSDLERAQFHLGLDLDCWGATCDFTHTGSIALSLPDNVSFTSDSGVFLTGVTAVAPVPEPETWALMLAGFGVIGSLVRRRRQAVVATDTVMR